MGGHQPGAEAPPKTRAPSQAQCPAASWGWTGTLLRLSALSPGATLGPWHCLGPAASRGLGFSRRRWLSQTLVSSESLALPGTALFPETALSSSTEIFGTWSIYWGWESQGLGLLPDTVSSVQQTASRSPHVPCPPGPPARPAVEEWVPAGPRSPGRAAQTAGPPLTSAPSRASGFFLHWGLLPAANSLCVSRFWALGQRPGSGCYRAPWPNSFHPLTRRLPHGRPACRASPLHSGLSLP